MDEFKPIMNWEKGLKFFDKKIGFDSAIIIDMYSRAFPEKYDHYMEWIQSWYGHDLSDIPVQVYSHPGYGHSFDLPPRKEILPVIESTEKHYLILDDTIETGEQCGGASRYLIKQNVPTDNIWLLVRNAFCSIDEYRDLDGVFDRLEQFTYFPFIEPLFL
jgi:hypothetical protein